MSNLEDKIWLFCFCIALCSSFLTNSSYAQTFTTTTTGNIDNNVLCPGVGGGTNSNLIRTIDVSGVSGVISDLDVGFLATHTWRGDISFTLTSPAPSSVSVSLYTVDTGTGGQDDNYNIRLDDEAPGGVTVNTGAVDGNHDSAASPYQFTAVPNNPLSVFDGIDPNGTWELSICDSFNQDNGQFLRSDLFITTPNNADLSLNASTSTTTPIFLDPVTFTVDLVNSGPLAATNVSASIPMPTGLTFDNATGDGTYDETTGLWTLPSTVTAGSTQTITITAIVQFSGSYNISGEITTTDQADPDSTASNGSTNEDDDFSVTVIPQTNPTPPSLTCPLAEQFSLVWDAPGTSTGWTAGSLSQSYTVAGEPIDIDITGDTGFFLVSNGDQSPVTNTLESGGQSPAPFGVDLFVDFPSRNEEVVVTMNLGTAGTGVEEVQFTIFDVDAATFADRITVSGSLSGTSKTPTFTTSSANQLVNGEVHGITSSPATSGAGNVTITFLSAVDVVSFTYGNHAAANANPGTQAVSLQPITMCPRRLADISAEKLVEAYDPGATGDVYMTPGSEVLYKIRVTNSAAAEASADDIDITDTLPPNLRFVEATTTGFVGGSFGSPALPAVNQDCGDTPCIIRFTGGSVPINTVAEVIVRATIK